MDMNRILSIVSSELASENLKLQEKLESTVNSIDIDVDLKVLGIKQILRDLVINEQSLIKFQAMVQPNNQESTK